MTGGFIRAAELRGQVPKEVYEACVFIETKGWTFKIAGHKARAYGPCGNRRDCSFPIPGTPPNPGNAARRIRHNVHHCPDAHGLIR